MRSDDETSQHACVHEGTRLGPYEILAPVGSGGMGEVYRARDTRLGRDVAIKVLPAEFATDPDRLRRFEQEARAAAALSHPNILVLFDVGRYEGQPYLVTELLEGETLRDHIARGGLTVSRSVELGIQIAKGLAAAHEKGIVHRDLKPGNVFVTNDGTIKLLDFGLAKLTQPVSGEVVSGGSAGSGTDTASGLAVGTVGYMAPEQIRLQAVDHRADIFAFGCVLYEMLSGRRAFQGETPADTMSAILTKDPEPLSGAIEQLPAALDQIVRRCLEKRPADRFSSAHDVALALPAALTDQGRAAAPVPRPHAKGATRRWQVGGVLGAMLVLGAVGAWLWRSRTPRAPADLDPKRVVVAVFENRTGDPALDGVGLQVMDALTHDLGRVKDVNVAGNPLAASGSVSAAGGAAAARRDPLRRLATATAAALVVAGAYYRQGEQLQFDAQVIDPWNGKVLFAAEAARGTQDDLAEVLEDLGERVGGAVAWEFDPFLAIGLKRSRPPRFSALREFHLGFAKFPVNYPESRAHFEKAIAIEPDFVVASVMLTWTMLNAGKLAEAAREVVTLESRVELMTPFERTMVRWIRAVVDGRRLEALAALREATAAAPTSPWLRGCLGDALLNANRPREAITALDGLDWFGFGVAMAPYPRHTRATAYHLSGDYEGQLRVARDTLQQHPEMLALRWHEAAALAALGRVGEIDAILVTAGRHSGAPFGDYPGALLFQAATELRAHGHRADSLRYANLAVEQQTRERVALFGTAATGEAAWGLEVIGESLAWAERWNEATKTLLEAEPGLAEGSALWRCRGFLGSLAARRGDRGEAERMDDALRRVGGFGSNGWPSYDRARIVAQLGDRDRAVALLREAAAQGLAPYNGSMGITWHTELDLEPLWDYPPFLELIRPEG